MTLRQVCLIAALFVGFSGWATSARAMSFVATPVCSTPSSCVPALVGTGAIDDKTPTVFEQAVAEHPDIKAVSLTSKGGSLVGGLRLGLQIRRFQLDTYVDDDCFSACAYAFLGGVIRTVGVDGRIGVHQFRAGNRDLDAANAQKITAVLGAYLDRMGIDRRLLDTALLTPTHQVVIFTPEQLKVLKVDNTGQAFSPWRTESTERGHKIALWTTLYPDPDVRRSLTIGISPLGGALRLLVIVRSASNMAAFSGELPLTLSINGRRWPLKPLAAWSPVNKGMQISYTLPPEALSHLVNGTAQEMQLLGLWPALAQNGRPLALRIGLKQIVPALKSLE